MSRRSRSRRNRREQYRFASPTPQPFRLALRPLYIPISQPPVVSTPRYPDRRTRQTVKYALKTSGKPNSRYLSPFQAFQYPRQVMICVRRKIRKQVLFARGGAGSRKMKKPRRNSYSDVRC